MPRELVTVYKFDELSEVAKQNAILTYCHQCVSYDQPDWEWLSTDAEAIEAIEINGYEFTESGVIV